MKLSRIKNYKINSLAYIEQNWIWQITAANSLIFILYFFLLQLCIAFTNTTLAIICSFIFIPYLIYSAFTFRDKKIILHQDCIAVLRNEDLFYHLSKKIYLSDCDSVDLRTNQSFFKKTHTNKIYIIKKNKKEYLLIESPEKEAIIDIYKLIIINIEKYKTETKNIDSKDFLLSIQEDINTKQIKILKNNNELTILINHNGPFELTNIYVAAIGSIISAIFMYFSSTEINSSYSVYARQGITIYLIIAICLTLYLLAINKFNQTKIHVTSRILKRTSGPIPCMLPISISREEIKGIYINTRNKENSDGSTEKTHNLKISLINGKNINLTNQHSYIDGEQIKKTLDQYLKI